MALRPRPLLFGTRLLALAVAACDPAGDDDTATPEPECANDEAPTLAVQPVEDGQPAGFAVTVLAQATDPDGMNTVTLYYRHQGDPSFQFVFMDPVGVESPDLYAAEIPGDFVLAPGVEYYVRATDQLVPCTGQTFWPEVGPDGPATFSIQEDVRPLPFREDWEFDSDPATTGLDDLGWTVSMQALPQGIHAFRLDGRSPLGGDWTVSHGEGIPGGFWECPTEAGVGIDRDNWLVSPPLNLQGKASVALRWFEREVDGWFCEEVHEVWISVTSPDPAVGGYELVTTLPLPGESWQSSPWTDLSPWADAEKAYIALRYHGGAAGRWILDDFYVGEPLATLQADSATPQGDLAPGATGLGLDVVLRNVSTQYDAPALTATLTSPDDGVSITSAETTWPALPAGQSAGPDGPPWSFDIEATHPDNAWLDFTVLLSDGAGHDWTVPLRVLMGAPSTLDITYTLAPSGSLQLEVGHGPPAAPTWTLGTTSAALGGAPWARDITDQAAVLPPGPGTRRWFLRATNTGSTSLSVDGMTVTVGGVDHTISSLPAVVAPGDTALWFLPPKPSLSVQSFTTDPDPVGPGDHVVLHDLTLHNDATATAGVLQCVLDSADPAASGFSVVPVTIGSTPIGSGESATASDTFDLDVDATHTDAAPIELAVICTDGADSYAIPFLLPVPYAHPVVSSVVIDDDDGNEDGFADPGEDVNLLLTVTNDGDFATSGPLTATVAIGAGSTAAFTLGAAGPLSFGNSPLGPTESRVTVDAVEIAVDPAALLGDRIVLDITWDDGSDLWNDTLVLEVSGRPWTPCGQPDDPQGDMLGAGTFDIRNCSFRSDGEILQLRLEAWEPGIDPGMSLWAFFYEVPNQFTLEYAPPGAPDMEEGCVAWDIDVPTSVPIEVETGDDWISLRLATDDLGILGDNVQVAFGSEYCAGSWWCDVFPNNAVSFNLGQVGCTDGLWFPIYW